MSVQQPKLTDTSRWLTSCMLCALIHSTQTNWFPVLFHMLHLSTRSGTTYLQRMYVRTIRSSFIMQLTRTTLVMDTLVIFILACKYFLDSNTRIWLAAHVDRCPAQAFPHPSPFFSIALHIVVNWLLNKQFLLIHCFLLYLLMVSQA